MGDTISSTITQNDKMEKYLQKLQFVQTIEDGHFGSIEIYRLKDPPYEYIMDYKKTFIEGDLRYVKYLQSMNQLAKTEHKNLAKIHLTEMKEGNILDKKETHMCIKDKKTHTFCNYYNFNLLEAIRKKKQQQSIFTESQLLYIMGCLVEVALYLSKFNISMGQYRPQNIYLSPEGYIKLYLLDIDEQNRHSCYYKVLSQKELIDEYILSPQQLQHVQQMTYSPEYDIYKSDMFSIGFLIFQLITQDDIKFYYNEQKTSYKFDRIQFDLDAVKKIYSDQFVQLVKKCLKEKPTQRVGLEEALNSLNAIKKNSSQCTYCIRLHDDEGKKKLLNRKSSLQTSPKAPILSHMTGKLMPTPITTLSSSSSSSFRANLASTASDMPHSTSNFHGLKKSPSLSSKTSENQTQPGLMEKFVQKKVIYFQK